MSLLAHFPSQASSPATCYADAFTEFDELERPTLSFRQLRVALPQFLFEELFESGSKKIVGQRPAKQPQPKHTTPAQFKEFVPTTYSMHHHQHQQQHQQQQYQQQQAQYLAAPHTARNSPRQPRKRSDSESSSSSADSMKVAGAHAAAVTPRSPPSPSPLRHDDVSNGYLVQCIRELPMELRNCFTEWRRERKEAILAHDVEKQQAVEKVMWNALNNIKAARKF